jgi:hypothetical protein
MDGATPKSGGETRNAVLFAPEHDLTDGGVIRQHGDDDSATEQAAEFIRGFETESCEPVQLVRPTDIGDHLVSGGSDVGRHRRPHVTQADNADLAQDRRGAACGRGFGRVGAHNIEDRFAGGHVLPCDCTLGYAGQAEPRITLQKFDGTN